MKKILTIILSVLLMATCFTVNTFADDEATESVATTQQSGEGQNSETEPETTSILSQDKSVGTAQLLTVGQGGEAGIEPTQTSNQVNGEETVQPQTEGLVSEIITTRETTTESMKFVVFDGNGSFEVSMIKENIEGTDSYQWKINPKDDFFEYADYNIFCKGMANKVVGYNIVYNNTPYSSEDIKIAKSKNDNVITAKTTLGDTGINVLLATYFDQVLYVREINYDQGNLEYGKRAITSYEKISIALYEQNSYALFFGYDYTKDVSDTKELISIDNNAINCDSGFLSLNEDGLLNLNAGSVGLTASVTYGGQTLVFESRLPDVGLYTSSDISVETYCSTYPANQREFYINWNNNLDVSLKSVSNYDNVYSEGENADYTVSYVENKNSIKVTFSSNADLSKGLEFVTSVSGNNFYINANCQRGDTLYVRGVHFEGEDMVFENFIRTAYDNSISIDIFNNRCFKFYYGSGYKQDTNNSEDVALNSDGFEINGDQGFYSIDNVNGVVIFNPTRAGLTATASYNGHTIRFESSFPAVGLYTESIVSELTYCTSYKDRKEFYINWTDNWIQSVSISKIEDFDNNVYSKYSAEQINQNSSRIVFDTSIANGIKITVNVMYKDGNNDSFDINSAGYDEDYNEITNFIVRNNHIYYKETISNTDKTINCYIHESIVSQSDAIINALNIEQIPNNSNILIDFNSSEYNSFNRDTIFFDQGVYFLLKQELSIDAYLVENPKQSNLDKKISLNPIVLNFEIEERTVDYLQNFVFLFERTDTAYIPCEEIGNEPLNANKQYRWYFNSQNNTTGISMYTKPDNKIYFATSIDRSYFEKIGEATDENGDKIFKQLNVTAVSQESLQDYLDQQFTIGGSVIKIGQDISFTKDLRITNYVDSSMNDVSSNNTARSVLIDLNGKTLSLGSSKIIISKYSTVHIKNGTITGSGDTLFENYGGLSLDNVQCTNWSGNADSFAIKSHIGTVYLSDSSTIDAKNGMEFSDSFYKSHSSMPNSCKISGSIIAVNDGLVFKKVNAGGDYKEYVNITPPNSNGGNSITPNGAPSIVAKNVALKCENKVEMMICGTETGSNSYDAHIKGGTAMEISSGNIGIQGNVLIESTNSDSSNIKINSNNVADDLTIDIDVSHRTNFESEGRIIDEINGNNSRNILLNIYYDQGVVNSKFTYGKGQNNSAIDPFLFSNSSSVEKNISGGYYSNVNIGNHLTSNYTTVTENNYYKVVVDSPDPETCDYTWDYAKTDSDNISELIKYCTNLKTRTININSFKAKQTANQTVIEINNYKTINVVNNVEVNGVKFLINADKRIVRIGGNGSISNNGNECIELTKGELQINGNVQISGSGTNGAIFVTGGKLQLGQYTSVSGPVALNVQAQNSIPAISVCGDLTGTGNGGVALSYAANPSLSDNINDFEVYVVGREEDRSNINGRIVFENGKLVTMYTTIKSDVAVELKGRSQFVADEETNINESNTGVYLNGSGQFMFDKGILEAEYPVKIKDNKDYDNYLVVFQGGTHCSTTDGPEGKIINLVDNNGNIIENNDRSQYHTIAEMKSFFNVEVDEKQFSNLNYMENQGSELEGMYKCVQFTSLTNTNLCPYTIGYKLESVKHNSLHLNFTNNQNISVDSSRLDYLLDNQSENEWTLLVLEEAEIDQRPEGAIDAYDIQVRKINSNREVNLLNETFDYQNIIIPVDRSDIDKIIVSHKHGDEAIIYLPKLTKEEALKYTRECYYINNDSSIGIITKRFSIFGIVANSEVVLPKAPNIENPTASSIDYGQHLNEVALTDGWNWVDGSVVLNAGEQSVSVYKEISNYETFDYSSTDGYDPNTHRVTRNISIIVNKADPSYTLPTDLSATYGNTLSDVTLPSGWKWQDSKLSVGNANADGNEFIAIYNPDPNNYNDAEVKLTVVVNKATPVVSGHPDIKVTYGKTFGSIKLENGFKFNGKNLDDKVGNAGEYTVTLTYTPENTNYKSVDVEAKLIVEKAYPAKVQRVPEISAVEEGTKLGSIELEDGRFKWKNPNALVSDTNIALYTEDETNYYTIEVNIPVPVKKTMTVGVSTISVETTSSVSHDSATNVTISNDALTSNAEKVVNRILDNNLGDIKVDTNVDAIKNIVNTVKEDSSLTLVVETVLKKEEKTIDQIDADTRDKITSALNGNDALSFLDLKVDIKVTAKDAANTTVNSTSSSVSELEDALEISVAVDTNELPVAQENQKVEYFVIPIHNGVALDPIPANIIDGKLVFTAKMFSYYTLSYKIVDIPANTGSSSSGSSSLRPVVNTASY